VVEFFLPSFLPSFFPFLPSLLLLPSLAHDSKILLVSQAESEREREREVKGKGGDKYQG
jgi:hypothetical protein